MPRPYYPWHVVGNHPTVLGSLSLPRKESLRNITGDFGGLVTNPLFLLRTAGGKGRGSMVPTLRLGRGLSAGYKSINDHLPSSHHSCILIGLGFYWLGYLFGGI